jgi:hypothetical protein
VGKTPKSEMMKLMHRYGWTFSCGCEPPTGEMDWLLIVVSDSLLV